jgi:cob(I)alamin adenosyltransferase
VINKGLIYLFTGEGKGKTSAALGVATRMLSIGKKVVWISWFKSEDWPISEKSLVGYFPENLLMFWAGKGFYIKSEDIGEKIKIRKTNDSQVVDMNTLAGHKKAAKQAIKLVYKTIKKNKEEGGIRTDLLVMDEIIQAIKEGLVPIKEVLKIITSRGEMHLVLTGRGATHELIEAADLVSEIKKIKHPYDKGLLAERGLDY